MANRTQTDEELELQETDLSGEQLDTQVQKAQEQLYALKRQQDLIEKQKRELEELSKRQDQLHEGRAEMVEKLTRALVVVERETLDAEKRVELLQSIDSAYHQHLMVLEGINPKSWDSTTINRELSKALSAVDDARAEYQKSRSKITPETADGASAVDPGLIEYESLGDHTFVYWLKSGLAFTLPLLLVALVIAVIFLNR